MVIKESHLCGKSQQSVNPNASLPIQHMSLSTPMFSHPVYAHPWREAEGSAYYRAARYNVSFSCLFLY